jgi:hypothetical protein
MTAQRVRLSKLPDASAWAWTLGQKIIEYMRQRLPVSVNCDQNRAIQIHATASAITLERDRLVSAFWSESRPSPFDTAI